jgi:hypothetical protein
MANRPKKFTPPQLARIYGVSPDKVLVWIRSGELRAINVASKPDGRPRYLIDESDISEFEKRRAAVRTERTPRSRKGGKKTNITKYY